MKRKLKRTSRIPPSGKRKKEIEKVGEKLSKEPQRLEKKTFTDNEDNSIQPSPNDTRRNRKRKKNPNVIPHSLNTRKVTA
jgi:nitrate reductase cytochrome c-type subunit